MSEPPRFCLSLSEELYNFTTVEVKGFYKIISAACLPDEILCSPNCNLKRRALHPNAHRGGVLSGTPGHLPVTFLRARPKQLHSHCRGGYQPPVRYNPTASNQSGRIRTIPNMVPFNRTRKSVKKAGGYEPPLRWHPYQLQFTYTLLYSISCLVNRWFTIG